MVESKYPMIPVEEAQRIVLEHTRPLEPVPLPLTVALGRVLAEDVQADEDMPPFAASAKDGFAVVAADSSPVRRVIGGQAAGYVADLKVEPGTAARITTGAPLPPGADAVVMVEHTDERDGHVVIHAVVQPGDDVRPSGQDMVKGQVVLAAGSVLGPAELGVLATVGRSKVTVYPRPRVAILSTGDELVEPDQPLGPGQIRDSNRYALMAAVTEAGGRPISLGVARDNGDDVKNRVNEGLLKGDVLISSGGVSMGGEADLVKPCLERRGAVHFGRIRVKPGKPVTFATVDGKLAFGLPGFPVSSLVSFELFVRPALLKMQGHTRLYRATRRVTLSHDVRHAADRTEFQRAVVVRQGDEWVATTTGFQGSGRLLSMVGTNALLRLPHGRGDFAVGERVEALIIGQIG